MSSGLGRIATFATGQQQQIMSATIHNEPLTDGLAMPGKPARDAGSRQNAIIPDGAPGETASRGSRSIEAHADGTASYEPIAVIGCAMRLPGGVSDERALWTLLDERRDGRCKVPESRYNVDAFYGPGKQGHVCARYGQFLEHVDLDAIDPSMWTMTRKELEEMDPQQRIALEVVYECLQRSGTAHYRGRNIGTYFGVFGEDWADMHAKETQHTGVYRITGIGDYIIANRVSYEFGFRGPSIVTRTACAASLTSLHQACMDLQGGECESAIVGGSSLILNPQMTIAMAEQGVLSPDGCCKTFDASANGYVRAEAVVALHIKKLCDAVRDNDPIRGVIRATCVNSDGRTAGLTHPGSFSHEALMRRSHALAGVDIRETAMIECHGTGTAVGDPLETGAVARVFGDKGIYIGAIKSNLGHSEGASGITGVIKAMLAIEKQRIPPNINFTVPNPKIPFVEAKLAVPVETMPWPVDKAFRIGVNSYGVGGSNAHVLIESAPSRRADSPMNHSDLQRVHHLLLFSTSSQDAARQMTEDSKLYLTANPAQIANTSYTLALRREHLLYRSFAVLRSTDTADTYQPSAIQRISDTPDVAFVFTGQGAQFAQMGAALLDTNDTFRKSIQAMEKALAKCADPPRWSLMDELRKPADKSRMASPEFSQPCSIALQCALVDVFALWGVVPTAIVGHSGGETAGAYAAGALTAAQAVEVAYYRGLAASTVTMHGGMAAIGLGRQQVSEYLQPGVVIGCENSPQSVTISGDLPALDEVMERIRKSHPDILVRALKVDCAYHSHHMKTVEERYSTSIAHITAKEPLVPFFSSVTGERLTSISLGGPYWVQNLLSPVLFSPAVSALLKESKESLLVEIGPHSALAAPVRQILKAEKSKAEYLACLVRGKDAEWCLMTCAGNLFQQNVTLRLDAIVPKGKVVTDLPLYPWQREHIQTVESRLSKEWRQRAYSRHDILGSRVIDVSGSRPTWRNMLSLDNAAWIRDHQLLDDIVFPAAGYIAMAGEAVRQLHYGSGDYTIRDVDISNALVMHEGSVVEIITHLQPVRLTSSLDSEWYEFHISSLSVGTDKWVKHAVGKIRSGSTHYSPGKTHAQMPRLVDSKKLYSTWRRFGLNYGSRFKLLQDVTSAITERKATGAAENFMQGNESFYALHPCTIDQIFQLFIAASMNGLSRNFTNLSVPTHIGLMSLTAGSQKIHMDVVSVLQTRGSMAGDADCVDPESGRVVLKLRNLKSGSLTDVEDTRGHDPHAGTRLVWKPDVNFVDNSQLMRVSKNVSQLSLNVERLALAAMIESAHILEEPTAGPGHLLKYHQWMRRMRDLALQNAYPGCVNDCQTIASMSSDERRLLIEDLFLGDGMRDCQAVATAVYRTFHALPHVFQGTIDPLEVLVHDNLLEQVYTFGNTSNFDTFFQLAAHYKPNMRILEIGAGTGGTTSLVLPALCIGSRNTQRQYSSYTYTDVSPGFLGIAKERFKDYDAIDYKVLDITQDPVEQGYDVESFDLIVASNVIHATPSLTSTLSHVRKLLSPQGRFFLQELSPPTKWINFVMGTLSGWWLGEGDGRVDEPYVSPPQWEPHLRQAGFDGIQALHQDGIFHSTMIAVPSPVANVQRVTLLCASEGSSDISKVTESLISSGYHVDIRMWTDRLPLDQDIVCLMDIDAPFFHNISLERYQEFQDLVHNLGQTRLLWVTGISQMNCSDPRYAMLLGVARTVRRELSANFATLELEHFDQVGWKAVAQVLPALQRQSTPDESSVNMEWVFSGGELRVGRFQSVSVNDELSALSSFTGDATLQLDIAKRGFLNSLCWRSKPVEEPGAAEVRVRMHAVGLNFKDVMVSMGLVEGRAVEGNGLGGEGSGIVEATGCNVRSPVVGDRVVVCASGAFTTLLTVHSQSCIRIPATVSFDEAASMPVVYATALHCLVDKAQLDRGQSVLIHSACGGVGIAAIQICQSLGVDIYCTVGSEEKAQHLQEVYQIPRHRIFQSRDLSFRSQLLEATANRGVDVVLNSLSGELLHASWECVADFGTMIEISKRDLIGRATLDMSPFQQNKSYIGVDFARIAGERPEIVSKLLVRTMELLRHGAIKPVTPITTFGANDVQSAMRTMQKGEHIGKIVVRMPVDDEEELPIKAQRPMLRLRNDACYVIVGGLGGLGQAIAIWLAEAGATELLFLSRSAGDMKQYAQFVSELRELGCDAILVAGSVADQGDVEHAFRAATKPIKGVMQASMVLRDREFRSMTLEDFQTVLAPKVDGTWHIHNILSTLGIDLDYFILFSSWSGIVGNWGQANYGAANAFLDAFVQYRHSLGLPASVLDIGLMQDIGFVSQNAEVLSKMTAASVHALFEQDLLDSLQLVMHPSKQKPLYDTNDTSLHASWTSPAQLTIGLRSTLPLSSPNNRTVWKDDIRMAGFRNESHDLSSSTSDNSELKQLLANAATDPSLLDSADSATVLAHEIGRTLFALMVRDADVLDTSVCPADLGVDSLVSIELRNWFRQKLSVDVTVLEILNSVTIHALGVHAAKLVKARLSDGGGDARMG